MTYPITAPLRADDGRDEPLSLVALDEARAQIKGGGVPDGLVFHRKDLYDLTYTYWWTRPESFDRNASIEHLAGGTWLRWRGEEGNGWISLDLDCLTTAVVLLDASDPYDARGPAVAKALDQNGRLAFSQHDADSAELHLTARKNGSDLNINGKFRPNSLVACLNQAEMKLETFDGEDLHFSRTGAQTVIEIGNRLTWALRFPTGQIIRALNVAMARHL